MNKTQKKSTGLIEWDFQENTFTETKVVLKADNSGTEITQKKKEKRKKSNQFVLQKWATNI